MTTEVYGITFHLFSLVLAFKMEKYVGGQKWDCMEVEGQ